MRPINVNKASHISIWLGVPTNDDSCEGALLSIILLVHHTNKGSVRSWLPYRCSMNEILQGLHTQVTGFLRQHKADGIHKVGLSCSNSSEILVGSRIQNDCIQNAIRHKILPVTFAIIILQCASFLFVKYMLFRLILRASVSCDVSKSLTFAKYVGHNALNPWSNWWCNITLTHRRRFVYMWFKLVKTKWCIQ